MADILDIAKGRPTLKTQLMYKANLSFTQLNDYLSFLINNNLIIQTIVGGKEVYIITVKGLVFLRRHRELTLMLKTHVG